ncbi:aldo/keto reductase [Planomonospora venezuelensis]|uniref:Aryl-alcohol dehydrogenase-like predicted oxidoreductase n=1 Tax=Planomonospora venezuelensis TaxID=1999 RepID=A0A841D158_PLAVE|nr:aryl-alcohol dehydrogenase-like predicted oxidoreductase [Planomonospora venezuelensis]GIM98959.1 oxidoreductase [Planomonospora venezuelensis]
MRYTRLGPGGPVVSAGLGTLALSGAYGPVGPREADRLVRRALDAGVTLLDTAGFYADGQVESLIGRVLAGRAGEVVVCTRGGARAGGPGGPFVFDGRPHELERSLHASLRRLRTDCVDLFSLHCQDTRVPVERSVAGLAELVRAGKIRRLGLSGGTAEQVRRAHAVHAVSAIGVEYSLWGPRPSPELLATARELGIAVIAARPLGRGFLTGRVRPQAGFEPDDWRRADPRFHPDHRRSSCPRLQELESVAAQLDLGAGRVALSWLFAQGEHVVPVPSTRDPVHLEMNLAASSVELPPETLGKLDDLFPAARHARSASPLL